MKLIHHPEAVAYLRSIDDPIVQALIRDAHGMLFGGDSFNIRGDLDLLFFYKFLHAFLKDREHLAKVLKGELKEDPLFVD